MYPLLMVVVLLVTWLLRRHLNTRETQKWLHQLGHPLSLLLQPYSFFFSVFAVLYLYLAFLFICMFYKYDWLDQNEFRWRYANATNSNQLRKDLRMEPWMHMMAVVSPVLIGATFVVTVFHLSKHLPQRRFDADLRFFPSYSHDLAMQVVALPLVYGIFGLDNVYQMLRLLSGEAAAGQGVDRWRTSHYSVYKAYEANENLADLYEAWALQRFGQLCFMLVNRQIAKEEPFMKEIVQVCRDHLGHVGGSARDLRRINEDLVLLDKPQELLFDPLRKTSAQGIDVFVYMYCFKSLYELTLQFLAYPPIELDFCGKHESGGVCSVKEYLDGACFLASTLAIMNIVIFERSLKDILEKGKFDPFTKFLSVKILVSVVFIQYYCLNTVLGSMWHYSEELISLCYACLVCCESLPLSLLVLYAWRPDENQNDWYQQDGLDQHGEPLQRGQLAREHHTELADSSNTERGTLESMVAGRDMTSEVIAVIELRGDINSDQGKALEDVINSLSKKTVKAQYKSMALFRGLGPSHTSWSRSEIHHNQTA